MDRELQRLISGLEPRGPADISSLLAMARTYGITLPEDYLEFLRSSGSAVGDVGETWLELWPVEDIVDQAEAKPQRYPGVLLFAGDGANTIYGFDASRGGVIIEGDWIGHTGAH